METALNQTKRLNPQSPMPLYHQLADILSEKIRTGEYPAGARIPSEHQLAEIYGIGRPTARQATETLVRKGVLTRRRGAGTFVREASREVDLFSLGGTMAAFEKEGVAITTEMLAPVSLAAIPEDAGTPFSAGTAYFFSRLSHADGHPVLIEHIYLHSELFHGIDQLDLAGRSLSRAVAEHFYLRPTGGKQTFKIEFPNREQGKQLAVTTDTPILSVQRFLHFPQADNAVFVKLFCRTDRFVFSQLLGEGEL